MDFVFFNRIWQKKFLSLVNRIKLSGKIGVDDHSMTC